QATLDFIGLYFRPSTSMPRSLAWTGWLPSSRTDFIAFQGWLAAAGLESEVQEIGKGNEHILMKSGGRIVFRDGYAESIQMTRGGVPKLRQLSVPIPDDLWDRIRQEAGMQKTSMSDLCSRWI